MQQRVLSGFELFSAFSSGGLEVIRQKTYLNSINVFPVPDGDTGSNLSSTMRSILENTLVSHSAGRTLHSMAEAALSGARGNSGIIFAQFMNGMSETLKGLHSITIEEFSGAVSNAARRAYEAINNPVEGTMLTVMREWAETVSRIHHSADSFADLFHNSMHEATESLRKTPERLKVLKTAKVTDAGAEGFVDFLRGIIEFFSTGNTVEYSAETSPKRKRKRMPLPRGTKYRTVTAAKRSSREAD